MKPGEKIKVEATVLRVEGDRVDAQLQNGQLLQTSIKNVSNKAVENAPENKAVIPAEKKAK